MDILFILIPLSVVMALAVLAGLWWAVYRGQFEDIEEEGRRIFEEDQDFKETQDSKENQNLDRSQER
jgi:cbb3-type cytochrome oxidase maturation protein